MKQSNQAHWKCLPLFFGSRVQPPGERLALNSDGRPLSFPLLKRKKPIPLGLVGVFLQQLPLLLEKRAEEKRE